MLHWFNLKWWLERKGPVWISLETYVKLEFPGQMKRVMFSSKCLWCFVIKVQSYLCPCHGASQLGFSSSAFIPFPLSFGKCKSAGFVLPKWRQINVEAHSLWGNVRHCSCPCYTERQSALVSVLISPVSAFSMKSQKTCWVGTWVTQGQWHELVHMGVNLKVLKFTVCWNLHDESNRHTCINVPLLH